jgi:hypothetical protein
MSVASAAMAVAAIAHKNGPRPSQPLVEIPRPHGADELRARRERGPARPAGRDRE